MSRIRWSAWVLVLVLAGCATTKAPDPNYPWPALDPAAPTPILVRSASVQASSKGEYSAGREALSNFAMAVLAGGRAGPLGLVIGVPLGAVGAVVALVDDKHCPPRAPAALKNVQQWVTSTFDEVPVVTDVAEAARHQLRSSRGPQIIASEAGTSAEAKANEVAALGARVGTSTLILADVLIELGEMSADCKVKLAVQAGVRVQALGQPPMPTPRFVLSAERADVPVESWAQNPDEARAALRGLLASVGAQLVDAYRERMGCGEQPCGW